MNKKIFISIKLTVLLVFCIIILYFLAYNFKDSHKNNLVINKVCMNYICFNVEVARTANEQEKGLMFRTKLDESSGMLFIFEKAGNYTFWMKNTLIPLDIIWINENKTIVYIKENALPCLSELCEIYGPETYAKYVLEINANQSKKNGIKIGEKVEFK